MIRGVVLAWAVFIASGLQQGFQKRPPRLEGAGKTTNEKCRSCGRKVPRSGTCVKCSTNKKQKPKPDRQR
jgi:hypothetical protein